MKEREKTTTIDADAEVTAPQGPQTSAQLFEQITHIAITLSYDLVDKLRYWEKETVTMPPEEIERRLGHTAVLLENLKKAYVEFAETDL